MEESLEEARKSASHTFVIAGTNHFLNKSGGPRSVYDDFYKFLDGRKVVILKPKQSAVDSKGALYIQTYAEAYAEHIRTQKGSGLQ